MYFRRIKTVFGFIFKILIEKIRDVNYKLKDKIFRKRNKTL